MRSHPVVDDKSTLILSVMFYQSKINIVGFFFTLNSRKSMPEQGTNVTVGFDTERVSISRPAAHEVELIPDGVQRDSSDKKSRAGDGNARRGEHSEEGKAEKMEALIAASQPVK